MGVGAVGGGSGACASVCTAEMPSSVACVEAGRSTLRVTPPHIIIGDVGVYLRWQQKQQGGGAVSALSSQLSRAKCVVFPPR